MRLAQLIDNLRWGGAQTLLFTFAKASRSLDLELTVISLSSPSSKIPLGEEIQAQGAKVVYFPGKGLMDTARIRRLKNYLLDVEVDVIHTHLTYANILGPWIGKRAQIPVVASLHNQRYSEGDHRLRRLLETLSLRWWADQILTVGYAVQEAQRARFPKHPLPVVSNAVDVIPALKPEERASLRQELLRGKKGPLLISVGQLTRQKGYRVLLEAMSRLKETFPESVLVVAGEGKRSALESLADELGLTTTVRFLGRRADIPRLLGAADLYVNSSRWEGLPISVLEAMSAGLPVVATAVGDTPRVLPPEAGYLVDPGAPRELADAINKALSSTDKLSRMGRVAREHVLQNFGAEAWVSQLYKHYQEVLEKRSNEYT